MKLYMHPASTASRPVMLFAAENNIPLDNEMVFNGFCQSLKSKEFVRI
jgi:hypothetical protein